MNRWIVVLIGKPIAQLGKSAIVVLLLLHALPVYRGETARELSVPRSLARPGYQNREPCLPLLVVPPPPPPPPGLAADPREAPVLGHGCEGGGHVQVPVPHLLGNAVQGKSVDDAGV